MTAINEHPEPCDETREMVIAWGTPPWLVDGLATYLSDGGELDAELWRSLIAAAKKLEI